MLQLEDRTVIRIRGSWAIGADYRRGDIVARGSRNYQARQAHIAGSDSEPMLGARWSDLWDVWDGASQMSATALRQTRQSAADIIALPAPPRPEAAPLPPALVEPPTSEIDLATRLEVDSLK